MVNIAENFPLLITEKKHDSLTELEPTIFYALLNFVKFHCKRFEDLSRWKGFTIDVNIAGVDKILHFKLLKP